LKRPAAASAPSAPSPAAPKRRAASPKRRAAAAQPGRLVPLQLHRLCRVPKESRLNESDPIFVGLMEGWKSMEQQLREATVVKQIS